MPSAHSPSRSRSDRKDAWPTAGTLLFTGADLDEAVTAATDALGQDVEVRAARSVKQGLRGKTHVEVLVTDPGGSAAARPPLPPPSEQRGQIDLRGSAARKHGRDDDPVEATLASLLASADADEDAYQRSAAERRTGAVVPFEPPPLTGNPSFAAEFAAAFPAALAAAKAAEDQDESSMRPVRDVATAEDFTTRVRDALRRVPTEDVDESTGAAADRRDDDTDELEIVRPAAAVFPQLTRAEHPALEMIDGLPEQAPQVLPVRAPVPESRQHPTPGGNVRRTRPSPGPLAMAGRPAALQRPAGSGWSIERLQLLGVPAAVLDALPAEEPADDLRWLVALTDAITATVPAPVENGAADVTASGTGLRGALALLRLGIDGVPPQTLTVEGRAVPATATELALAIRNGILR